MPQPNLRGPDGRRHLLDDIAGRGFLLIGAGVDPRASLDIEALALWRRLGARFVAVYPFGGRPAGAGVAHGVPDDLIETEDPDNAFFDWLKASGGRTGSVAIVRPDKFVFALAHGQALSAATREVERQMHCGDAVAEALPALEPQPSAAALARGYKTSFIK